MNAGKVRKTVDLVDIEDPGSIDLRIVCSVK